MLDQDARKRLELWAEWFASNRDWRQSAPDLPTDLRAALAALDEAEREMTRLHRVVERALSYTGPKWPNEMTQREKLAHLYCGDIDARRALISARNFLTPKEPQ